MTGPVILLVEDNEDHALLTKRALRKHHVLNEVIVAGDGQEALDYLAGAGAHAGRDPGDPPALILLDLNLPRLNGLETLCRIRADARSRLLPVVILTTSAEEDDIIRSYQGGANSYIRKPVKFDDFSEAIRQVGIYWLLLNVSPPPGRP